MIATIDATHDAELRSWLESANEPATDFPIQNLPFGRFRSADDMDWRIGVAIGDQVLDLRRARLIETHDMNRLMRLLPDVRASLRRAISEGLRAGSPNEAVLREALVPQAQLTVGLPCEIGDYTDFYIGIHHATAVGKLFRPDNPLLPNYKWVPIGYHGRASSLVVSGTEIARPQGQTEPGESGEPRFGPTRSLDYELEVAAFLGPGNRLGAPIPLAEAESHIVGLCLLNDWSARDVQKWEYQPLGPFLAKSFATSISPWVVTLEALAPYRVPAFARPAGDPQPLPHLANAEDREHGGFDLRLEVQLTTKAMRERGLPAFRVSHSNLRDVYWTLAQMVAHHSSNGCNLRPGDLIASGTVSGPEPENRGCLIERTWRGTEPLALPSGEERRFLEPGDEVILRGHCEREGFARIGFGECSGVVA